MELLDVLVTAVLNDLRDQSKAAVEKVMSGLPEAEYRQQAGIVQGLEFASQVLITKAKELENAQNS